MLLTGKNVVVTGAGGGIGAAMCRRFSREQPGGILVADIDGDAAERVASEIGGVPFTLDVADESSVSGLVGAARAEFGHIDLMCLNAGIARIGGVTASNDAWERSWEVNVMSHVFGAREVLPDMLARGSGYLLHTASAAGLLTSIGAAPYAVTKHAVVALAEWLSITYGAAGIKVSCLSPQFVQTPILDDVAAVSEEYARFVADTTITSDEVADRVVEGIAEERFHILPHPEVASYVRKRASEPDAWLAAMRKLQTALGADPPVAGPDSQ